jgi:integrase
VVALRKPGAKNPARFKLDSKTLKGARQEAGAALEDPIAFFAAREEKAETPAIFRELAELFLEHGRRKRGQLLRQSTKSEYRRALIVYAVGLHRRPVREIRRREIADLIAGIARERGETTAQRAKAALQRFWGWSVARDLVDANVVAGVEGYATGRRQRVLSDVELAEIWSATAEPGAYNTICRLCMWCGPRRGEAGGMAWPEIDGDIWLVPGSRTKNGRALALPLPTQAVAAIEVWPRIVGRDHLFGRGRDGFGAWSKSKEQLDERIARARAERRLGRKLKKKERPSADDYMKPWILHDFRRTVETRLASIGVRKDISNRILNHAAGPITETYDLYDYLPEKREALQRWANELERIVSETYAKVALFP